MKKNPKLRNVKIEKQKQQKLHFWLKILCKKTSFLKKNYFSETTFFNKKNN